MDFTEIVPARDGEEFTVRVNGGDWIVAWHPASKAPEGTPHGATAICLTADGGLVLISSDGERWGLPGGRPENQESWGQTLHREVLEEATRRRPLPVRLHKAAPKLRKSPFLASAEDQPRELVKFSN